jgi:hypothetical protein
MFSIKYLEDEVIASGANKQKLNTRGLNTQRGRGRHTAPRKARRYDGATYTNIRRKIASTAVSSEQFLKTPDGDH